MVTIECPKCNSTLELSNETEQKKDILVKCANCDYKGKVTEFREVEKLYAKKKGYSIWLWLLLAGLCAFGLFKFWLYKEQEKSCRDYAEAWLWYDSKKTYVTEEKNYKGMYDECMFLQGY